MMSRDDVMMSRLDILGRLLAKNTGKEGPLREGASTLRRFHSFQICTDLRGVTDLGKMGGNPPIGVPEQ